MVKQDPRSRELKKELRSRILAARKELAPDEVEARSRRICGKITESDFYAKATDICIYMPIRNEVDVKMLIDVAFADNKRIWIPKVMGDEMIFNAYEEDKLEVSESFGILESTSETILMPHENTLIIMPGAVFDPEGGRIGYGGGYYDRYLEKHPECHTIAVGYEIQIVEEIPVEAHDVRPEAIFTESVVYKCK